MEMKWTGLGFDPQTGCPLIEQDDRWDGFVEKHKGYPTRFLKKPLARWQLLRSLFTGSFTSSKYSYSPGCEIGNDKIFRKGSEDDTEETGDSDEVIKGNVLGKEMHDSDEESKSPKTNIKKGKHKSVDSVGNAKKAKSDIEICLEILKMSLNTGSPSLQVNKHTQVATALNELQVVKEKGDNFMFQCMQFLREGDNGDYFLALLSQQRLLFLKTKFDISLSREESISPPLDVFTEKD